MPQPPGTGTLGEQFRQLGRRVDELSRNTGSPPLCVVRLTTDVTAWDAESEDVVPITEWQSVPERDERGMWHYNDNGDSFVRLPCAGRYSITVASKWGRPSSFNPDVPNCVSTSVLLNSRTDPVTNAIAEASAYMLPFASTCYDLHTEDRVLAAGDQLRINFWSRFASVRLLARSLAASTQLVVRYLGPR
ncbi:hypothetical protein [Saccharopolyspora spinosa]|uniref:Uncharacterized protein n=1 Tax=Saccharopolyspora spinosa TaxID=60894 RepID=A0A2N3XYZ5_SACSN|nr:hypothetical protein [Saccharopolyspora spinosa]PKW15916.1 hypothetical protein A8926_3698 [Saccharopolyspora spinosa]